MSELGHAIVRNRNVEVRYDVERRGQIDLRIECFVIMDESHRLERLFEHGNQVLMVEIPAGDEFRILEEIQEILRMPRR